MSDLRTTEEELSLAYVHAVCAQAGVTCIKAEKAIDNDGIDAILKARYPDAVYPQEEDTHLELQLKASIKTPADDGDSLSYWIIKKERYEKLRRDNRQLPRVLVVLFLPPNAEEWLLHSENQLVLKRCAYWASFRNGPPSPTETGTNVKLPKNQLFSPSSLRDLMLDLSMGNIPEYKEI